MTFTLRTVSKFGMSGQSAKFRITKLKLIPKTEIIFALQFLGSGLEATNS